jgi:hypothetical protein
MSKKDKAEKAQKADKADKKKRKKQAKQRAAEEPVAVKESKPEKRSSARALPKDRASLLALHRELRRQRDAAQLLSDERAEAVIELSRVEVEVARIERALDPPLV